MSDDGRRFDAEHEPYRIPRQEVDIPEEFAALLREELWPWAEASLACVTNRNRTQEPPDEARQIQIGPPNFCAPYCYWM